MGKVLVEYILFMYLMFICTRCYLTQRPDTYWKINQPIRQKALQETIIHRPIEIEKIPMVEETNKDGH